MAFITAPEIGSGPRRLRVVCISDTHGKHWEILPQIPPGDILIHAGDFTIKLRSTGNGDHMSRVADFNKFLGVLPHRHKIVIAGNHEIAFNDLTPQEIQGMLSNCIYLQDSAIELEGLKFYGTPWTNSTSMGFSKRSRYLHEVWDRIPIDTDVLITHLPPFKTLDLAFEHGPPSPGRCRLCDRFHPKLGHWGCRDLLKRVRTIQPLLHVFGHVHDSTGYAQSQATLFVNAAMDQTPKPIVVDISTPDPEVVMTSRAAAVSSSSGFVLPYPVMASTTATIGRKRRRLPPIETSTCVRQKTDTESYPPTAITTEFVGLEGLKEALTSRPGLWRLNLRKLRRLCEKHAPLVIEEFPFWMFPVDQPGTEGKKYAVDTNDVQQLLQDSEYMCQYREAACLTVRVWGWDLLQQQIIAEEEDSQPDMQHLYLFAKSLCIFHQDDLFTSLREFATHLQRRGQELAYPGLLELFHI